MKNEFRELMEQTCETLSLDESKSFEKELEKDNQFLKDVDKTLDKFKNDPYQILRKKPEDMVGAVLGRMGVNKTSGFGRIEDKYNLPYAFWNSSAYKDEVSSLIKIVSKRLVRKGWFSKWIKNVRKDDLDQRLANYKFTKELFGEALEETSISSDPSTDQASMSLMASIDDIEEANTIDRVLAKELMKHKVDKKFAPNLYKAMQKSYKKDGVLMAKDVMGKIEKGSMSVMELGKYIMKLIKKARKESEDSKSHLSVIPLAVMQNALSLLDKDGVAQLKKMSQKREEQGMIQSQPAPVELEEAKDIGGDVTRFGLANNAKRAKIKIVHNLKDINNLVPEKFQRQAISEMEAMLNGKSVKPIGRTMYFEVPDHADKCPKKVAKEMFDFLNNEGMVMESIIHRDRNKFLKENKQNRFLLKGSRFLKESSGIVKDIEGKIEGFYDKEGKGLDKHDFEYEVNKDGSFSISFNYERSLMKSDYFVDKNHKKMTYVYVDNEGHESDESYRVKDVDDAIKAIMKQG